MIDIKEKIALARALAMSAEVAPHTSPAISALLLAGFAKDAPDAIRDLCDALEMSREKNDGFCESIKDLADEVDRLTAEVATLGNATRAQSNFLTGAIQQRNDAQEALAMAREEQTRLMERKGQLHQAIDEIAKQNKKARELLEKRGCLCGTDKCPECAFLSGKEIK